jgi:hypothetical protein
MNELLRYAFDDARRQPFCTAFVGATGVATDGSGVVGLQKTANDGKSTLTRFYAGSMNQSTCC